MSDQIKQLESGYSQKFTQAHVMNNWMYAPGANGNKRANLKFDSYGGMPRVIVKTNVPDDQDNQYGKIEFICDAPTILSYIAAVKRYARGEYEPGHSQQFQYKSRFAGPKRFDEPVALALLVVGRTKDGRVYTSVFSSNTKRPRIPFFFGPSPENHGMLVNNEYDARAESEAYAAGWAELADYLVTKGLDDLDQSSKALAMGEEDRAIRDRVHEVRKSQRGKAFSKRQNGGGNRQQSSASQGGPAPATFDDFGGDDFDNF